MNKIIVTGTGTGVGKTIASAILATAWQADYWKPIQCGDDEDSDTATIRFYLDPTKHHIHAPAYSFRYPVSPHHAARLEGVVIDSSRIYPPTTQRPLVIETAGGIFVPLTIHETAFDVFKKWDAQWVVVSRHYLGSINHTLLTIDALKYAGMVIKGIIFNGSPNPDSEEAILTRSRIPLLGRILNEPYFNKYIITRYACQWNSNHL